jgi:hypothetical protein
LTGSSQFRALLPPSLKSRRYAEAYNEGKASGALFNSARTPEQTDLGLFWFSNYLVLWNHALRDIAAAHVHNIGDSARLFALANLAMADAAITAWDTKFHCVFSSSGDPSRPFKRETTMATRRLRATRTGSRWSTTRTIPITRRGVVGQILTGPSRPRDANRAELTRSSRSARMKSSPSKKDRRAYVIHLRNEPDILWVLVRSEEPIFTNLRQQHARWITEHPGWNGWIAF